MLGAGDDQRDLVGPDHRQHCLGGERDGRDHERHARADQPARVTDTEDDRDQPDDDEVRHTRHRGSNREPDRVHRCGGGQQAGDDHRDGPAGRQAGQSRYEPEHDEVDAEKPQQCDRFAAEVRGGFGAERQPHREQSERPGRQVPEDRSAQPLRAGEQPGAPRFARVPPVCARGAAGQEEQGHDLHHPRDRGERGNLTEDVADSDAPGVDGRQQQRAMAEHDDDECGQAGDVDGAVAVRRRFGGEFVGCGHGCGERHAIRMPRDTAGGLE
ncbi:hypothetical protein AU186_19815 [Mycobacterium sp. GA-1999]|nr:hypothetical protein AU185_03320 [Mycobacterium sp. GA-0227b]KUH91146.1 hypothetical protein AU186_19815 [Mycobacterium sp. GA-1999]KUH95498.1 hypothetical protein AU187_11170 [Mycobacterium sp. IS-1556]